MTRIRVRPSRAISVIAMIASVGFVVLGLVIVIPLAGPFGMLWTLVAALIGVYHAFNVFTTRGISISQIDINSDGGSESFGSRLREIDQLRKDGLLTDSEYRVKREQVMMDKW